MSKLMNNLNNFKIEHALGSQNQRKFNQVFLVSNRQTNEKGVLKILKKTATNLHVQDLIRHESNLRFSSKFLPEILCKFEDEETIAFILKYREGITLKEYFSKLNKTKKTQFILVLFEKLNLLFKELDELKLVHGDIRPSNIIIDGNELDFEVYLIDFGLSFYTNDKNFNRKLVFPLAYAAPELILNRLHLANQSTDLYALGISLFQLFKGGLPFIHKNPAVMTNLQLTYPIQVPNEVPKEFRNVIQKMCYKFPFPKPPNLLTESEVESILIKSINGRYHNLTQCLAELKVTKEIKKTTFWQKLIQVFSVSKIECK